MGRKRLGEIRTQKHDGYEYEVTRSVGADFERGRNRPQRGKLRSSQDEQRRRPATEQIDRTNHRHRGKAERAAKTSARRAKQARRARRARAAEAFKRSHNERHRHNIPKRATEKETPPNLRLLMVPMLTFVHGWTMSPSPTH